MTDTLSDLIAKCQEALRENPGPTGREKVRDFISKVSRDDDFTNKYLGEENSAERKVLYEDPALKFNILTHVYTGAKVSPPHDHASSWAIYAQVKGVTHMTDWDCVEKPENGAPGTVRKNRTYDLKPGDAYLYNEGDIHSPERRNETRLIRVEAVNLLGVKRDKYNMIA